jgi:hypothetical protein
VAAREPYGPVPKALWLAVFGAGVILRVALFSGYGLGDDPNYFIAFNMIARAGTYYPSDPYQMRFGIWVPVVFAMKLFGQTELGFVGGILLCSIYNLALIYLLARQEWPWPYALLAMALLAVYPLDVLCSTLFANDMMLATWCFTAFFLFRQALAESARARVAFAWAVASGAFVLFGFVTKPWSILLIPLFAIEALRKPRAWRVSLVGAAAAAVFLTAYVSWQWIRFGDPLYHVNVARPVAIFMPYTREILLDYPRMLLLPNQYGARFAGFYPHLVIVLALVLAWRAPAALRWLLYFVILLAGLAALPAGRRDGQWVTLVPHIFRYLAAVSIPLALALAALLRELCRRRILAGVAVIAVVLVVSVVQSVAVTAPTRDAFGEGRRAIAVLRRFPDERVVSDHHLLGRIWHFEWKDRHSERMVPVDGATREARRAQYAALTDGMVVTGGARLPWYGCTPCNSNLDGFVPPPTWSLVAEFTDRPIGAYRLEPLRVWRVSRTARVNELLAQDLAPAARLALLRRLASGEDALLATELGRRLSAMHPDDGELAYVTGSACAQVGKLACATELLQRALGSGLGRGETRDALVALVSVRMRDFDFRGARRWAAELRRRAPEYKGTELAELESGMSEAVADYNQGFLPDALTLFSEVAARPETPEERRRRAYYYASLTLFHMRRVAEGVRWAKAYRGRFGDDPALVELRYREGEAQRITNPRAAREVFSDLAANHAATGWGRRAAEQLHAAAGTGR